jgi:5-methyltetrahydrofolate corrinoid/iron sulfur protein methyltransferase
MASIEAPHPFAVIGENIHATRTLMRHGNHIRRDDGGAEVVVFIDADGLPRTMPLASPLAAGSEFVAGKVKHIRNAMLLGIAGDDLAPKAITGPVSPDAARDGRDYLVAAARRQEAAGADYLDVNVDEVAGDEGVQVAAMAWLVHLLEPVTSVPLSLDSSSIAVLRAGLRASGRPHGALLVNSASLERVDVIDLAAEHGSSLIIGAAGVGGLPETADERVENARQILAAASARGIAPDRLHVDLLVLPVGVAPDAGLGYLDAARHLRSEQDARIRITGGLSNVSFGLPGRRLLNDVFVALAMDAGVDSGIVDPIVTNPARIGAMDRASPAFRLAADVLTGDDAYAGAYLSAFRAGELDAPARLRTADGP